MVFEVASKVAKRRKDTSANFRSGQSKRSCHQRSSMIKFCLDRVRCAHRCIGFPISMDASTDSEARNASVEPNSYQPPQQCNNNAQRSVLQRGAVKHRPRLSMCQGNPTHVMGSAPAEHEVQDSRPGPLSPSLPLIPVILPTLKSTERA